MHDSELFEERAAIREFDGGMSRADAEAAAAEDAKAWQRRYCGGEAMQGIGGVAGPDAAVTQHNTTRARAF